MGDRKQPTSAPEWEPKPPPPPPPPRPGSPNRVRCYREVAREHIGGAYPRPVNEATSPDEDGSEAPRHPEVTCNVMGCECHGVFPETATPPDDETAANGYDLTLPPSSEGNGVSVKGLRRYCPTCGQGIGGT